MNEMELIKKKKKLSKGDLVEVGGEEYEIENYFKDDEDDKKIMELDLVKKNEGNENKFGRKKFKLFYNEKTGEKKLYKESEEKEVSEHGFSYQSKKVFFSKSGGTSD